MAPSHRTTLLATLCILPTCLLALPIVGDTRVDRNGVVRPHTLIARDLKPVILSFLDSRALGDLTGDGDDASASGPTGSSSAQSGLTGTSGSAESASEGTSSSSSTSCRE
jgi:hypothetical protein